MSARTLTANNHLGSAGAAEAGEVQEGLWRLAARGRLDADAAAELRDACLQALDRGAVDVVFELTGVEMVSEDVIDLLDSTRDCLVARAGNLWIAVQRDDELPFAIVAVDDDGLCGATGVSPALDRAVASRRQRECELDA